MNNTWERVGRTIDSISKWSGWFCGWLLIPLTVVVVYAAVMRRFGLSPDWAFEVSIFLYGTAIILAGAEVLRHDEHVTVDVIPQMLSLRPRRILAIFASAIIILVCVVLVLDGSSTAWTSTLIFERSSHQSSFNPYIWWYRWVLPVAAFLLMLQAIRRLGDGVRDFNKKEETHA